MESYKNDEYMEQRMFDSIYYLCLKDGTTNV